MIDTASPLLDEILGGAFHLRSLYADYLEIEKGKDANVYRGNPDRIDQLTERQLAMLPVVRDYWLRVGLSTDRCDRPAAQVAVADAYGVTGLAAPEAYVWLDSPIQGAIAAAQVRAQVRDQVRDQVGAQVRAQVSDQVWAQVRDQVSDQVSRAAYGLHDSEWLSFYDFFREECSVESCKRLDGLSKIAKSAGWFWPFTNVCILSERPCELHRDPRFRLHCEDGPAIKYPDGWCIYAWHGIRVDSRIIEKPESITVKEIDRQPNAEIRRIMIERYGMSRYLIDGNAKKIHSDDFGTLYRREFSDDEPLVMVHVVNSTKEPDGSYKDYFLRVPANIERARQAVAWTWGDDIDEFNYAPLVET